MKVLVIGGGGREHALVWGLKRSVRVTEVVCAPGNAGIAAVARCEPLDVADAMATVALAEREQPELVVIGPEVPLAMGVVDALEAVGLRVFGPTRLAAELETSKIYAKDFMQRHGIRTARCAMCRTVADVDEALKGFSVPVVVKADGLAAGKGVVIAETHKQALEAAGKMFSGVLLGEVLDEVLLEEFLPGEELSFFALCDGTTAVSIAGAQDHKRVGEGDTGPNTGGMGAYSTDDLLGEPMESWLLENVAQRVVTGMAAEGRPFRGILFCGMMLVPQRDGTVAPMVLEFNTRWGDPETEAIVPRLETDLFEMMERAASGRLGGFTVRLRPGASACVVLASGGYPGAYEKGVEIEGLDRVPEGVEVFHAGTARRGDAVVTAGGRVLAVAAVSEDGLGEALGRVYAAIGEIRFEGMQFRRDIGWRAMGR